ncbi:transcription elongation factor GreA [Patescibacteria group bacterium]|nr:transcription elongation factor GreA [Patescibacteria group bacterium]
MVKIAKFLLNRKEPRIPFTQAGYDKIVAEKAELEAKRPEAVDHLKKAREMGDLSENGYYKASRQQLNFIDGRLRRVTRLIKLAKIVTSVNDGTVQIGSTVKLKDAAREYEYIIVGGYESNPGQKSISHISPLGRAILGKRINDVVEFQAPSGTKTFTIIEIS